MGFRVVGFGVVERQAHHDRKTAAWHVVCGDRAAMHCESPSGNGKSKALSRRALVLPRGIYPVEGLKNQAQVLLWHSWTGVVHGDLDRIPRPTVRNPPCADDHHGARGAEAHCIAYDILERTAQQLAITAYP